MENYKDIPYEYKSKYKDQGIYRNKFRLLRKTARMELEIVNAKSGLTAGISPGAINDIMFVSACAHCQVLVKELGSDGKPNGRQWAEEIIDRDIIVDLANKCLEFQDSFLEVTDNATTALEPVATV